MYLLRTVAAAAFTLPSFGTTLVSVTPQGGNTGAYASISQWQLQAVQWTLPQAYYDVSIFFNAAGVGSGTATAYLMSQIGPGATSADEVATASFSYSVTWSNWNTYAEVFHDLTLDAGTHYLVIGPGSDGELSWGFSTFDYPPVIQTAPGVTTSDSYENSTSGSPFAYPPAANFFRQAQDIYHFEVTGSPIPEPATWTLLGGAVLVLGPFRRRSAWSARRRRRTNARKIEFQGCR
jgi:hypothetical protein